MVVPTAVILRTPGTIARALTPILIRRHHPFGVEVIGDSSQMFASGGLAHPLRPLLRWWFTGSLQQQCTRACAVSYVTERILQQRYPAGSNAFVTSYSSINLPDSAFVQVPKPPPVEGATITVASVGSMEQIYKGFDDLIRAILIIRTRGWNIRLLLIGGGRLLPRLRALADQLGVEVEFTGELPGPDAVRVELNRADCFVLSSKSEGLPRVIIEAMALALPCIATTVGGTPELLPPEHLAPPGSPQALADSLENLLRNRQDWLEIGLRNQKRAMDFHERILSDRRRMLYLKVNTATYQYYGETK